MLSRLGKLKISNHVLNNNNPEWKEEINWLIEQAEHNEKLIKGIDDAIYSLSNEDISDEYIIEQIRTHLLNLIK